jgi:DNA-binding transcriptional MerR regulator
MRARETSSNGHSVPNRGRSNATPSSNGSRRSSDRASGPGERYSIDELSAETGITPRTIRYYITEGMIPPAYGRGASATYDRRHLLRLRLIVELKNEFKPLDAIKQELSGLSTEDLEAHFAIQSDPAEGRWRRIAFSPDLELHVREREPRDYRFEQTVDQLVQLARVVLRSQKEIE